ncbi:hypothetical protein FS837_006329, partial [Tulasnella sp. UAMH 9824]
FFLTEASVGVTKERGKWPKDSAPARRGRKRDSEPVPPPDFLPPSPHNQDLKTRVDKLQATQETGIGSPWKKFNIVKVGQQGASAGSGNTPNGDLFAQRVSHLQGSLDEKLPPPKAPVPTVGHPVAAYTGPKTWATLAASNNKKWGADASQEATSTSVEEQDQP